MRTARWIFWIIFGVFFWRIALFGVGYLATISKQDYTPTFPYSEMLEQYGSAWWTRWGSFDGVHYLSLVTEGYRTFGLIQAFFPAYPLLAGALSSIFAINPFASLMFLSHAFLLLGVLFFELWMRELRVQKKARMMALLGLLTFPGAYSLGSIYTESLFFALFCIAAWALHKRYWWLAIASGAVLSATRVVGVFFAGAVLLQTLGTQLIQRKLMLAIAAVLMTGGLLAYSLFLWKEFNDPLYFFSVQKAFDTGRQTSLVLLPQVLYRVGRMLSTVPLFSYEWWLVFQDTYVFGLISLFLARASWLVWKKKNQIFHWSYLMFSWGVLILPTLTGTLQSMTRYGLAAIPFFVLFGSWSERHPRFAAVLILAHAILLIINTVAFMQGRFVS